jgi:hypothetical protein
MQTLLIHINNAEAFKIDVDDLPQPNDNFIIGKSPREKTEKEVNWIEEGVTTLIIPMWRITFIEVLPSADEAVEFPLPFRNE